MARITDPQKIENVKRATIEIVVEYGYRGASIAAIAKKANVSVGYLYRYYKNKDELLEDLVNASLLESKNQVMTSAKTSNSVYELFYNTVYTLFELVKKDPIHALMGATLMLDADFEKIINDDDTALKQEVLGTIFKLGKNTGEINQCVSEEDIALTLMTIPFRYVSLRAKEKDYLQYFQREQIEHIVGLCLKALR